MKTSKFQKKERVHSPIFENAHVYGDKIIIHKCEIDQVIKKIKGNPDPYEDAEYRQGKLYILDELNDIIRRGMNIINKKNI